MLFKMKKIYVVLLALLLVTCLSGCSDNDVNAETATVNLYVDYQKCVGSSATPMYICIDGEKITVNGNKAKPQNEGTTATYTVNLTKGEHEFSLKNSGIYETDKIKFNVSNNYETFSFGAKIRLSFGVKVWKI